MSSAATRDPARGRYPQMQPHQPLAATSSLLELLVGRRPEDAELGTQVWGRPSAGTSAFIHQECREPGQTWVCPTTAIQAQDSGVAAGKATENEKVWTSP